MSHSTSRRDELKNGLDLEDHHHDEHSPPLPLLSHRKSRRYYIPDKKYLVPFPVPSSYDFSKLSEENYRDDTARFVGCYGKEREQMDYSFHSHYSEERQLFHDQLIDMFHRTIVHDVKRDWYCESPLENWVVFTAGVMGAGKGHTMDWLDKEGLFPKEAFVNVDPDALRFLLPEFEMYNSLDRTKTGYFTQKEVGYISEVLTYHSLQQGKNVLVDGSLRDAHWYLRYFKNLRQAFPKLKLAILHIEAPLEAVIERSNNRARVTGRVVPPEVIRMTVQALPESLEILRPQVEFFATIVNDNHRDKFVKYAEMKKKVKKERGDRSSNDDYSGSKAGEEDHRTPFVQWPPSEGKEDVEEKENGEKAHLSSSSMKKRSSEETKNHYHQNNPLPPSESKEEGGEEFEVQWRLFPLPATTSSSSYNPNHNPNPTASYLMVDEEKGEEREVDGWKMIFSDVWIMTCEIPLPWMPSKEELTAKK